MISVDSLSPHPVMDAELVQAFQALILNGDRVGSLFSYPVNMQRAILIEGKKSVSLSPRFYQAEGKPFRQPDGGPGLTSCSQLGQVHCDRHSAHYQA